jgi:chemotaxis signal transduction protein
VLEPRRLPPSLAAAAGVSATVPVPPVLPDGPPRIAFVPLAPPEPYITPKVPLGDRPGRAEAWVCFEAGGRLFGVDPLQVRQVLPQAPLTPWPKPMETAAAWWRASPGVLLWRGHAVPVIDWAAALSMAAANPASAGFEAAPLLVLGPPLGPWMALRVSRLLGLRRRRAGEPLPTPLAGAGPGGWSCVRALLPSASYGVCCILDADALCDAAASSIGADGA